MVYVENDLPVAATPREKVAGEDHKALAQEEANIVGDEEKVGELTSTVGLVQRYASANFRL